MEYVQIDPEVPGSWTDESVWDNSSKPFTFTKVAFELAGWQGSHLITSHPVYLASDELVTALHDGGVTGFEAKEAKVTVEEVQGAEMLTGKETPHFQWLDVTGKPESDDLGLDEKAQLIASAKAAEIIKPMLGDEVYIKPVGQDEEA